METTPTDYILFSAEAGTYVERWALLNEPVITHDPQKALRLTKSEANRFLRDGPKKYCLMFHAEQVTEQPVQAQATSNYVVTIHDGTSTKTKPCDHLMEIMDTMREELLHGAWTKELTINVEIGSR